MSKNEISDDEAGRDQTSHNLFRVYELVCKIHLIYEHLAEEVERYGLGTALLNESAVESLHADFDGHYQGYQVKDIDAPAYQKKLLHAVKTYNAGHV